MNQYNIINVIFFYFFFIVLSLKIQHVFILLRSRFELNTFQIINTNVTNGYYTDLEFQII